MTFRHVTAAVVVLSATALFAQTSAPVSVTLSDSAPRQKNAIAAARALAASSANNKLGAQSPTAIHRRVKDMEGTLEKMHAVLKQMRSKSSSKDPVAKANLDMWELMVGHLDEQLQELRIAAAARDEFEGRRAIMYKRAEAKADAEAEAARAASAGQAQAPTPAAQREGQSTGGNPVRQTTGGQAAAGSTVTPATSSAPN